MVSGGASLTELSGTSMPRVALFVDGENISHLLAGRILELAASHGRLVLRCVFGDMTSPGMKGWETAPSFRAVHAFHEKDSADIRLAVEAMAIAYTGRADVFVIATSDTGLAHLVHHLTELGFPVYGVVEKKATPRLRKAYSAYDIVAPPETAQPKAAPVAKAPPATDRVTAAVVDLLTQHGDELGWMKVQALGTRLSQGSPKITRKDCGRAKWVDYFNDHPKLFQSKGSGSDASVRLRGPRSLA